MGETTCLMQPFSYVSGISSEAKEGNPIHALGQSISFGRFVSESLAWEKWSTFSHNRYVEEAERYSRPGSVAQKKAFFEAHYKKIAARKAAAALLEQANVASNDDPQQEVEGDSQMRTLNSHADVDKRVDAKVQNSEAGLVVDANEHNLNVEMDKSENKVLVENSVKVESSRQLGVVDDKVEVKELELSGKTQMEKPLLKTSEMKPALSISKSLSYGRASKLPSSPTKPTASTRFKKENNVTPTSKKSSIDSVDYVKASKLPSTPTKSTAPTQPKKENNVTPTSKKSSIDSVDYVKASKLPSSLAKSTAPTQPKKENNATPTSKKSAIGFVDKKRSTPKSSHKSINFTPAREINRLTSTIIRKFDSSRVGSNTKASKDCSTPIKTPITASMNGAPKHPLTTPWSENRRTRTPLDPSTWASKTVRPKWHFLPTDFSKFLSPCRNKSQSPNFSTPFSFRTEERAARRKEKLEEKFNANQQQKVQQQATLKEKAETELKKLRQSLCFKARPLPEFYKERGTPKDHMKKVPLTHPPSPKVGRKPATSTPSQPPQRPSIKNIGSKQILEKNSQTPTYSLTSRCTKVTHENASPNIQHE